MEFEDVKNFAPHFHLSAEIATHEDIANDQISDVIHPFRDTIPAVNQDFDIRKSNLDKYLSQRLILGSVISRSYFFKLRLIRAQCLRSFSLEDAKTIKEPVARCHAQNFEISILSHQITAFHRPMSKKFAQ